MKQTLKRWGILTAGWAFIVLGIAGLFLPVLQGILFLLIGLIILSSEYVWAHHLLRKLKERFPRIAQHADQAAIKAEKWLRRFSRRDENRVKTAKGGSEQVH
jgi:uncharacterized membrane protein YbaN (DUF454 family)